MLSYKKQLLIYWKSKFSTIILAFLFLLFFLASHYVNFGPPSPAKIIGRLFLIFLLLANLLTNYPQQTIQFLLGKESSAVQLIKKDKTSFFFILAVTLVLVTSLLLNLYNLAKFFTIDEGLWLLSRIPNFFSSLVSLNWHQLFTNDKPGVTVTWLVETGLIFTAKEGMQKFLGSPELLFFARFPLLLANVLLLLWLTLLVKRALKSEQAAVLFLVLTATNPTIRGMAPIVNPDSISWFFPLATVLSFFLYLQEGRRSDLVKTAFLFSGGVLTKFNFLSVMPFLPIVSILFACFFNQNISKQFFRDNAFTLLRIFFLSGLISATVWPYLIINPSYYLEATVFRPIIKPFFWPLILILISFLVLPNVVENIVKKFNSSLVYFSFLINLLIFLTGLIVAILLTSKLPFLPRARPQDSIISLLEHSFFYHFYSQTTATIILFVAVVIFLFIQALKKHFITDRNFFIVFSLLYINMYLIGSGFAHRIAAARYQVAVFPFVSLFITAYLSSYAKKELIPVLSSSLLIVNIAALGGYAPYYLFYANKFLPPGKVLFDGWGLGGYEAAQFLNKKPNAKRLNVYASYAGFGLFFKGQTKTMSSKLSPIPDYIVVFKQSAEKFPISKNKSIDKYYRYKAKPEFQLEINKVPIVKVIKVDKHKLKKMLAKY